MINNNENGWVMAKAQTWKVQITVGQIGPSGPSVGQRAKKVID